MRAATNSSHVECAVNDEPNLLVESGPDKGMEIRVPVSGARLGRASGNDIVLTDPALSRFHCRFYYKDGRLHVSDLASTNETLINGRPSMDGRLTTGDRVTIGQTVLKVLRDSPSETPVRGEFPPAPASVEPPAAPGEAAPLEVDLGLARDDDFAPATPASSADRAAARRRWLAYAVLVVLVAAVAVLSMRRFPPRSRPRASGGTGPAQLEVHYEKIEASPENIFRYAVDLEGGQLAVRVDNLQTGQHIRREKATDPKVIELLASSIEQSGFFQLMNEYSGISPNVWVMSDLTIIVNRRAHRVKVLNRLPPDAFKKVSDEIEEFVRNEMGLHALALPPEKLVELGKNAWLSGKKLFDEREVRHDNLARAIRSLTEAESLVESVEPKPPFYEEAIALREEARRQLQAKYDDYMFRADRAIKLNDWREANAHLQVLLESFVDRSDERYQKVYKKLVDVQRRLQRK